MADVALTPVAAGIRTASERTLLKAAATAITDAYAEYPANPDGLLVVGWDMVRFTFVYTNGDETTIQVVIEGWDGTAWGPLLNLGVLGSGVREAIPEVIQLTKATINTYVGGTTATSFRTPWFDVLGLQKLRVKIKANNAAPTGTVAIYATGGILIAGRGA
jgi:hypothetical protein